MALIAILVRSGVSGVRKVARGVASDWSRLGGHAPSREVLVFLYYAL